MKKGKRTKYEYYLINNVYGRAMTIAFYRADDRATYDVLMRRLRENEVIMREDKKQVIKRIEEKMRETEKVYGRLTWEIRVQEKMYDNGPDTLLEWHFDFDWDIMEMLIDTMPEGGWLVIRGSDQYGGKVIFERFVDNRKETIKLMKKLMKVLERKAKKQRKAKSESEAKARDRPD